MGKLIGPGVELSVHGGVHVLAIFGPETAASTLDRLLGAVEYMGAPGKTDGETRKSFVEVARTIAKNIEKIYGQNCQNIGLLTSTDTGLIDRIKNGEEIPISEFTKGLDPIAASIVEHGGLFAYNTARLEGRVTPPEVKTAPRPMTLCEKIVAQRALTSAVGGSSSAPWSASGISSKKKESLSASNAPKPPFADCMPRDQSVPRWIANENRFGSIRSSAPTAAQPCASLRSSMMPALCGAFLIRRMAAFTKSGLSYH